MNLKNLKMNPQLKITMESNPDHSRPAQQHDATPTTPFPHQVMIAPKAPPPHKPMPNSAISNNPHDHVFSVKEQAKSAAATEIFQPNFFDLVKQEFENKR